jgi:hypothetical protein
VTTRQRKRTISFVRGLAEVILIAVGHSEDAHARSLTLVPLLL